VPVAIQLLIEATETLVRGNAAERSEVRALADRIEALNPEPRDYLSSGRYLLVAFGLVAVGDVGRAARLALLAGGDADLSGYVVVDRGLTFELLVAAAAIDGDLDAAESWAERSMPLVHSPIAGSTIERITSRVELMRGNAADAIAWADRAVTSARAEGRIVEAAEGEVVASRARISASQAGEAGVRLEAMVGEADDLGFAAARRSAARELRAVGRRLRPPPGSEWDGLSARERDVAVMVAEDLTNAQIAAALHLSEHTVRSHVSRVLAAFGAASRSRVAGRIAGFLPPVSAPAESLTPRQRTVAVLIAGGAGNTEIASELGVSVKTVEQHVGEILRRWDMRSRVAVARAARALLE
jgi:DNA-binding NarL/FixJ family response regulator